jgi:glycosyltransferase involved in cell wall biosynthesis
MMEKHSKLSVVVITKNLEWNIGRLLDSVLAETADLPGTEVIVADSASTDETVSIASKYRGVKVVRLRSDQRLTPGAGRYVGSQYANGEHILFPGWLQAAFEVLEEKPEIGGVTGIIIDVPKLVTPSGSADACPRRRDLHDVPYLIGRVCLYRRAVLDEVGTFHPYLFAEEEPELALRIRHAGYRLVEIQQPAGFHHSDEIAETFTILLAHRRRNFLVGLGQNLRILFGTPTFWPYVRERGFAFIPVLTLLAGAATLAIAMATRNWLPFELLTLLAVCVLAAYAIRNRSIYKTALSLLFRALVIVDTVRGVLLETPDPKNYQIGAEVSGVDFHGPATAMGDGITFSVESPTVAA